MSRDSPLDAKFAVEAPQGLAPHNIHGAYEFTVKVQCSKETYRLMIYDEKQSFTVNPDARPLYELCFQHGMTGRMGSQPGTEARGKKAYFAALRDGNDALIFTDKVLPEPEWGRTKKMDGRRARTESNKVEAMREFTGRTEAEGVAFDYEVALPLFELAQQHAAARSEKKQAELLATMKKSYPKAKLNAFLGVGGYGSLEDWLASGKY